MRVAAPLSLVVLILAAPHVRLEAQMRAPQLPSTSPFLGGVPSGTATPDTITITLVDAMRRALERNLAVLNAENQLGHAQGARWKALSDLLPNVNGRVGDTRQQINLQAFGFGTFDVPGGSAFPNIVGPFNVFDARVYLSQSVLDFGTLNDVRAEAHNVEAARQTIRGARDLVVFVTGTVYLQALAASARADAARVQQATAETLHRQALDLKQSGIIAGIDVLRAEVELNAETQRSTSATNEFEKAKLQLARLIGLPLGQKFALDPMLPVLAGPEMSFDEAIAHAYQSRADYQASLERVRAAEASRRAVVGAALPSLHVNADYGDIGLTPSGAKATFTVAGAVNVPIFQGGRTRGKLAEADADLRNRQNEADDMKASIYYEVQSAFLDLQATSQQLQVATKARDLAEQQLAQSRDRFAAGVASNIEVVQAQQAVAVATEQHISALYGYDLAKGALLRGVGSAEDTLQHLLGGSR